MSGDAEGESFFSKQAANMSWADANLGFLKKVLGQTSGGPDGESVTELQRRSIQGSNQELTHDGADDSRTARARAIL